MGGFVAVLNTDGAPADGRLMRTMMRVEPYSMQSAVFPLTIAFWISCLFMFISHDLKSLLQTQFAGKRHFHRARLYSCLDGTICSRSAFDTIRRRWKTVGMDQKGAKRCQSSRQ